MKKNLKKKKEKAIVVNSNLDIDDGKIHPKDSGDVGNRKKI